MDEYSGRKGVDGVAVPKRGSRIISRDSTKISRDQSIQLCNRIGCSGRLNPARAYLDKTKVLKTSSRCCAHGKDRTCNSLKGVTKVAVNPALPLRLLGNKPLSSSEVDPSASSDSTSSDVQKAKVPNTNPLANITHRTVQLEQKESKNDERLSMKTGNPGASSNGRGKRTFLKKPSSVVDSSISSRTNSGASKITPQLSRQNASSARPGSRYLRCSFVPEVAPSDSASSSRKQMLKRNSESGEGSSSSKIKQTTLAENTRNISSRSGILISETRQAQSAKTSRRNIVSSSARSSRSDTSTARHPPQMTRRELPTGQQLMHLLPNSQSVTGYPHWPHSYTRPRTYESSRGQTLTSPLGVPYSRNLVGRENLRQYNLSGFTELLMALDRIEHGEEMSIEQLLALESNFVLGGLTFQDQHRDMRLDIDNMTYEELLALEEKMGSVSTALSEDALAKCIKKSVYNPCSITADFSDMDGCEDDTKCSICQEEYKIGDEMGRLHCKHSYHVDCIDQWLRQKNWCPICKSSAAT